MWGIILKTYFYGLIGSTVSVGIYDAFRNPKTLPGSTNVLLATSIWPIFLPKYIYDEYNNS